MTEKVQSRLKRTVRTKIGRENRERSVKRYRVKGIECSSGGQPK